MYGFILKIFFNTLLFEVVKIMKIFVVENTTDNIDFIYVYNY